MGEIGNLVFAIKEKQVPRQQYDDNYAENNPEPTLRYNVMIGK